jgi:hypothetical protein
LPTCAACRTASASPCGWIGDQRGRTGPPRRRTVQERQGTAGRPPMPLLASAARRIPP